MRTELDDFAIRKRLHEAEQKLRGAIDDLHQARYLASKRAGEEEALERLEDVERRHVLRVLAACRGNKTRAARILGVNCKTIHNKLNAWGLQDGSDSDTVLRPATVFLTGERDGRSDKRTTEERDPN